jgi:hypothetical protein
MNSNKPTTNAATIPPLKLNQNNTQSYLTDKTFEYSLYFIVFAFIVSFISTILVKDANQKVILFIEILITGISSIMYYLFSQSTSKNINQLDLKKIDKLRYNGWSFSTPLMMCVLCLVLSNSTKIPFTLKTGVTVVLLDYIMLLIGYLGEIQVISNRILANVLGFIPFFAMFYVVFTTFIHKYNFFNYLVFFTYLILWALYGIAYLFDEDAKNILTNFLDVTAKGVFAIGISLRYMNVL